MSMDIDKLTADINTYENDLSELIQLKIWHQIDDIFYNKEYQRIRSELDALSEKKESLREVNLNHNKNAGEAGLYQENHRWEYRAVAGI